MQLDALAPFLGRWATRVPGTGVCPRGSTVRFHETLELRRLAPADAFVQLTHHAWDADSGGTLHTEAGVIRVHGTGLELSLALSSGRLEHGTGGLTDPLTLDLTSRTFTNDRLQVIAFRRVLTRDGELLRKQLYLATHLGWPELTPHMQSVLYPAA